MNLPDSRRTCASELVSVGQAFALPFPNSEAKFKQHGPQFRPNPFKTEADYVRGAQERVAGHTQPRSECGKKDDGRPIYGYFTPPGQGAPIQTQLLWTTRSIPGTL
ncbi:MAG: hypothetical protein ACRDIF_07385 [Actinomycetota bacterium]